MTNDDYEYPPRLGEILCGILGRLARSLVEGENVICLDTERLRREIITGADHATDLGPVEGGSAFVIPWTKITRCAGMIGQRS